MRFFILILLMALSSSDGKAGSLLGDDIISDSFTPATTSSEITPTGSPTVLKESDEECQCVPYYLCDFSKVDPGLEFLYSLGYRDPSRCLHYLEACCTKSQMLPRPQPDPAKVKGCGYSNPKGFGGDLYFQGYGTKFGEFPWVIALLDSKNSSYAGAGVLISPEVVMTVAHVAKKFSPGTLKIRAGEWNSQTVTEVFEHQEREVKEISVHEEYQQKTLQNDIALLRLEHPLELTEHINTICMPEQGENFNNSEKCVSNGWGKDDFDQEDRYAVVLKKAEQNIVPHDQCETLLRKTRLGSRFNLHDSFVCAVEDGKGTCNGDGGAALACPTSDNRYKLTGLVAWGLNCGQRDIPSVHTNVPKYRGWVDKKMEEWGLQPIKNE